MNKIKQFFIFALVFVIGGAGVFVFFSEFEKSAETVVIKKEYSDTVNQKAASADAGVSDTYPKNLLSGVSCANYKRRPYAVMFAEDPEARPLSGIGLADLVVEMPVITGSITRMMALFVCADPSELGSVRSARHDFISLARGYDAIFAHWGGEKEALVELNSGIIDNLDALPNYFEAFFRKKWIQAPHNGFTTMAKMESAAKKLGYRTASEFAGYEFTNFKEVFNNKFHKLKINYKYPYNVLYEYDGESGSYFRWRGGLKEVDRLTGKQVRAKNVAVMVAESRQISKDYNDVDILGRGEAAVHRNGEKIAGFWRKQSEWDALRFFDRSGEEIKFVRGGIWVEIVEPTTEVIYE